MVACQKCCLFGVNSQLLIYNEGCFLGASCQYIVGRTQEAPIIFCKAKWNGNSNHFSHFSRSCPGSAHGCFLGASFCNIINGCICSIFLLSLYLFFLISSSSSSHHLLVASSFNFSSLHCFISSWLYLLITSSLHCSISSLLYLFNASSLQDFIYSLFHLFMISSLRCFVSSLLPLFMISSLYCFLSSLLHHFLASWNIPTIVVTNKIQGQYSYCCTTPTPSQISINFSKTPQPM